MSQIDRKSLKEPDAFKSGLQAFFSTLTQNRKAFFIVCGIILGGAVGFLLIQDKQAARLAKATAAWDEAKRAYDDAETKDADKDAKNTQAPRVPFAELYAQPIQSLSQITKDHVGTRPALEAAHLLGSLYLKQGEWESAIQWFKRADELAQDSKERAFAKLSLGRGLESAGRFADAAKEYQAALGLGQALVRGDLLLSIARAQDKAAQADLARASYELLIKELPGSTYAQSAEVALAQLKP